LRQVNGNPHASQVFVGKLPFLTILGIFTSTSALPEHISNT
jgi:hypothetical protein